MHSIPGAPESQGLHTRLPRTEGFRRFPPPSRRRTTLLRFRTFGTIDLRGPKDDSWRELLDRPKRLALLAVLSARPPRDPVRREKLHPLLWPHSSPSNARSALNTTLSRLRKDLGAEVFRDTGSETLGLSPRQFRSDVARFAVAVAGGRPRDVLELYRGTFLDGFHLPGNRRFESWLETRRRTYHRRAYRSAIRVGNRTREAGELEDARAAYRRALDLRPMQEEAAVGLIRVLVERGQRSEALQTYRRYRKRREKELGLPPSSELQDLLSRVRTAAGNAGGRPG